MIRSHQFFLGTIAWRPGRFLFVRVLWFSIHRVPSWTSFRERRQFWFRYGGFTARWGHWLFMYR
jgi:hypothetical protein